MYTKFKLCNRKWGGYTVATVEAIPAAAAVSSGGVGVEVTPEGGVFVYVPHMGEQPWTQGVLEVFDLEEWDLVENVRRYCRTDWPVLTEGPSITDCELTALAVVEAVNVSASEVIAKVAIKAAAAIARKLR